jgi:Carbohydrate-selective porin, OprB family/S-layer homology domain
MSKILFSAILFAPILLSATALRASANPAAATEANAPIEQVLTYGENTGAARIGQVTSVSQLSDVKPTDWAFQALQSLVERYGCIAGYPDKTYRGNRALTRYEFAAGLNACLDRVNELIAASTANLVKKEDLDALKKMQKEFADELAEVRGKVDGLENRTSKLEKQQFSTTTKLNGEIIIAVDGLLGGERAANVDQQRAIDAPLNTAAQRATANNTGNLANPRGIANNTAFGNRVRLNLDTSTNGQDRLRTRLQARNLVSFSGGTTNTNQTRLGFDGDGGNQFELSKLEYRFSLGKNTTVYIGGGTNDGLEFNDIFPNLSPTESSGSGSISRFGRFNPIYRSATGSGVVINHKLGAESTALGNFTASLGYLANNGTSISGTTTGVAGSTVTSTLGSTGAASPANKSGLFNGTHSLMAQLVYKPSPKLGVGFTYANAYYINGAGLTGGTGSGFANSPFGDVATSANSYSVQAEAKLTPRISLSGWVGFTDAVSRERVGGTVANPIVRKGDKAHSWNWAVAATFPDLLKEGNLGGIIFGMPPKVTSSDFGQNVLPLGSGTNVTNVNALRKDTGKGTTYHLEGFYRYKLSDNIAVTPGLFMIFNPENNKANNTIYVGTVRTTFTF